MGPAGRDTGDSSSVVAEETAEETEDTPVGVAEVNGLAGGLAGIAIALAGSESKKMWEEIESFALEGGVVMLGGMVEKRAVSAMAAGSRVTITVNSYWGV